MTSWDDVCIRIHSVPGFELVTLDVMRGDEIWTRNGIDGAGDPEQIKEALWDLISPYWDALCDSNAEPSP